MSYHKISLLYLMKSFKIQIILQITICFIYTANSLIILVSICAINSLKYFDAVISRHTNRVFEIKAISNLGELDKWVNVDDKYACNQRWNKLNPHNFLVCSFVCLLLSRSASQFRIIHWSKVQCQYLVFPKDAHA